MGISCFISISLLVLLFQTIYAFNFDDSDIFENVTLRIPWPSGIIVTPIDDGLGHSYKMGVLQHNTISIRPEWSATNVLRDVFTMSERNLIIAKADIYTKENGWPTRRHIDFDVRPTNDLTLPTFLEAPEHQMFVQRIESKLFPALAEKYNLNSSELSINDLFLTKYESSRSDRSHLGIHKDKSPWSFVVVLNDDFEEGGTYFDDSHEVWRPPAGSIIFFNGARQHGALPISSGNRYIIAGFCEYGATHPMETFESIYDPRYDGFAFQAGFRTGDIISGLQVCQKRDVGLHDVLIGGDGASGRSIHVDVDGNDEPLDSIVSKKIIPIPPNLSDEAWIQAAQSCEIFAPRDDTVMVVTRGRQV